MLYFVWGTCWYYWNYLLNHHFFFFNGCHFAKMSTLSDFNENWYLGVIWRGEHDVTIEILFRATIFFKMAAIYSKFQLCPISMKIDILGNIDVANMMVPFKFGSEPPFLAPAKWAIGITMRPSSVVSVNFLKNLLLWNHWTDFLETW